MQNNITIQIIFTQFKSGKHENENYVSFNFQPLRFCPSAVQKKKKKKKFAPPTHVLPPRWLAAMIDLHRPPTPPQRQHRPTTVLFACEITGVRVLPIGVFGFRSPQDCLRRPAPQEPCRPPLPASLPRPPFHLPFPRPPASIPSPSTQRRQEPARILHGNQGGATLRSAVSSAPAQKKSSFFCQRFPPLILDARRRRHAGRSARSTPRLPLLASGHPRRPLLR